MRYLLIDGKNRDSKTCCWADQRDWPVRSSLGGVLARFRYRDYIEMMVEDLLEDQERHV